jgi:death-on-curing protein
MSARSAAPIFLTVEDVALFHEMALAEFGGEPGIRDLELLQSAVAQASAGIASGYLHAFPFEMAAAYGFHLAKNHPFFDANKRVAWSAVRVFLSINGYVVRVENTLEVNVMLQVATGAMDKYALAKWLSEVATPIG